MKMEKIWFGGDYNPDQWDEATVREDMRLFRKAHINLVTLPVFSWAKLEPEEGRYDFAWLDRLMDLFQENGIGVNLATPTVAQPAWMSAKYPEVLPVDIAGRRRTHGMRVMFCYNSTKYRERAAAIARAMAQRYAAHPALKLWHVANEYGTHCYCPICRGKFIQWLKNRYRTLDRLNERWYTAFWGRTLYDWEEINLPTELNDDYRFCPTVELDYQRFVTDSTADCFTNEYNAIRRYSDKPIQTNMSGYIKKLDQFVMAKRMDIIGWDNYPWPTHDRSLVALKHDIMRGLKGGQSFLLAEQSPNQQNWQPYNKLKRPGEVRMLTYQALAHGADSCLFFQLKQSRAGQEKFHGAVVGVSGREDTRVFREMTRLGEELEKLSPVLPGLRSRADVGLLFDWNNWWALENSSGPNKDINYLDTVNLYYRAFYEKNIAVDILGCDQSFDGYKVIVAPMLYMIKPGVAEKLDAFVRNGGTLLATVLSGLVDENDQLPPEDYPAFLRKILGLRVEETDALLAGGENTIELNGQEYFCTLVCDVIKPEGAEILGRFRREFYAGGAAVTLNRYGSGKAYYIGSQPELKLLSHLIKGLDLKPVLEYSGELEITRRGDAEHTVYFALNYGKSDASVKLDGGAYKNLLTGEKTGATPTVKPNDVGVFMKLKEE